MGEQTTAPLAEDLCKRIGYYGRMLSGIKQGPKGHVCFFNACAFDKDLTQVWWGDVDLTASAADLQALADTRGETFYITREQPYRWDGLSKDEAKNPEEGRVVAFRAKKAVSP